MMESEEWLVEMTQGRNTKDGSYCEPSFVCN